MNVTVLRRFAPAAAEVTLSLLLLCLEAAKTNRVGRRRDDEHANAVAVGSVIGIGEVGRRRRLGLSTGVAS